MLLAQACKFLSVQEAVGALVVDEVRMREFIRLTRRFPAIRLLYS